MLQYYPDCQEYLAAHSNQELPQVRQVRPIQDFRWIRVHRCCPESQGFPDYHLHPSCPEVLQVRDYRGFLSLPVPQELLTVPQVLMVLLLQGFHLVRQILERH